MDKESLPRGGSSEPALRGLSAQSVTLSPRQPPGRIIPPARDRLQSRILTWALGAFLTLAALLSLPEALSRRTSLAIAAALISILFATAVSLLRAATAGAALWGGIVCLILILWTSAPARGSVPSQVAHSALTPLVLLFVCTFAATRTGRRSKAAKGLAETRGGRSASQVLANLAAAALCASLCGIASTFARPSHGAALQFAGKVLALATLAEATADTVSSEIGQALGGQPRMLLNLRPAPVGTNGAITVLGTAAGILAALLIAFAGQAAMHLHPAQAMAAAAGGIFGLFFDSLLGATVESRGWFGNDLVNFSSTLGAAFAAACIQILPRL